MQNITIRSRYVYITLIIITSLTTYSITTFLQNKNNEQQIENHLKQIDNIYKITTTNDKREVIQSLLDTQYKENIFLSQLNNNNTTILACLGFILTIGGLLSFKSFQDSLKSYKESIDFKLEQTTKLEAKIGDIENIVNSNQYKQTIYLRQIKQKARIDHFKEIYTKNPTSFEETTNYEYLLEKGLEIILFENEIEFLTQKHNVRKDNYIYTLSETQTAINYLINTTKKINIKKDQNKIEILEKINDINRTYSSIIDNLDTMKSSQVKHWTNNILDFLNKNINFIN